MILCLPDWDPQSIRSLLNSKRQRLRTVYSDSLRILYKGLLGDLFLVRRHMANELRGRRGLLLHAWQAGVDTSPARCAGCPNGHCRVCKIRIVKASNSNEDQMRSCLRLAEQRSTASRAKPPMHAVAAVSNAREVTRLPYNLECRRAKASPNRSTTCPQVLTIAAPANARRDRRLHTLPTNRAAKALARHCHCTLQGQERRHCCLVDRKPSGQLPFAQPRNPSLHLTLHLPRCC
jgi:hypothetical protein